MIPAKAHKAPALCVLTGIKSEKYERGIVMKTIDIAENTGIYASKWGISDFYEEAEQSLRNALASGEDFDTGWFGCKKEINYAQIIREDGEIIVSVCCHMDDLWDDESLIYDTMKEEVELPGDIIDSIRDAAIDDGIDDKTELSIVFSAEAGFDDIVEALGTLEKEAMEANHSMFLRLTDIVDAHIQYMKGAESNES